MCGIVGYIGSQLAMPIIINGLKCLEYRGYDSAGIAIANKKQIQIMKTAGKIVNLESIIDIGCDAMVGIGHTRWATHGCSTELNAHPHSSNDGQIVVVHNGIFENFLKLRRLLINEGYTFKTDTDTECFPVMVQSAISKRINFQDAFINSVRKMRGIYTVACLNLLELDKILVARNGPPLIIGLGERENFIASDIVSLVGYTNRVIYLEDGDLAEVGLNSVKIFRLDDSFIMRPIVTINSNLMSSVKSDFKHYMNKEIIDQSSAISSTLSEYLSSDNKIMLDLPFSDIQLQSFKHISILACGTSLNAAMIGKLYFEEFANLNVDVNYASEYYESNVIRNNDTLTIGITQSGETADTLSALNEARRRGSKTIAVCNVINSTVTRQVDGVFVTQAGFEIGVASTKAFTSQLLVLFLIALRLGELRKVLHANRLMRLIQSLRELPSVMSNLFACEDIVYKLASKWHKSINFVYLGRGPLYPIALEGALKLKETSYIHAEGFPAGEMKHGPIALVDQELPIIAIMPNDLHREKMLSNLQEIAARGGCIIALATQGDNSLVHITKDLLYMPNVNYWLAPILYVLPLQVLAYYVAVLRGCDVDQPRNLAKSVTVD